MSAVIAATLAATTNNGHIDGETSIAIFASLILLIWVSVFILKGIKHHYEVIKGIRKQNRYVKRLKETKWECSVARNMIRETINELNLKDIKIKDYTCFESHFIIHTEITIEGSPTIASQFYRTKANNYEITSYVSDLWKIRCMMKQNLEQDKTIQKFLIENDMLRNGIKKETEITIQTI